MSDIFAPIAAWPVTTSSPVLPTPSAAHAELNSPMASSSAIPITTETALSSPPGSNTSTPINEIVVPVNHPPTPAPSPRPTSHRRPQASLHSAYNTPDSDDEILLAQAHSLFEQMSTPTRKRFLSELLSSSQVDTLLHVSSLIAPRLKRDFLRELPIEVALHILDFIQEPRTLLRAACVSRYWHTLLCDEYTWKNMCVRQGFREHVEDRLPVYASSASSSSVQISRGVEVTDWEGDSAPGDMGLGAEEATVPRYVYRALQSRMVASRSGSGGGGGASAGKQPVGEKPFSYRKYFKQAYLTDYNWRQGGCVLRSHTSPDEGVVTSVAMDDEWIVVGLANQNIHIFSTKTGKLHRSLEGHTSGVWALHLVSKGGVSPTPLTSTVPSAVSTPDLDSGRWTQYRTPNTSSNSPSSSSSVLSSYYSYSRAGSPGYESPPSGSSPPRSGSSEPGPSMIPPVFGPSLKQSDVCNSSLGWGQEGAIAVTAGCDREVRVWDVRSGYCLHVLKGHNSTIRCIKVLDGRPIAVTGSRDQTLRVWDIQRGRLLHILAGHTNSVRALEVAGNVAVSGSYDCTAKMWNVDTGECMKTFVGHAHQVYAVAFDGVRVATGSLDSTVRLWSPETGNCTAILQGHTSLVGQLQLLSSTLVTGGSDGRAIIFSLPPTTPIPSSSAPSCLSSSSSSPSSPIPPATLHRLCAHDNSITCLQFDDRFLITGGSDGHVKLFELKTGVLIRELTEPCEAVWRVCFREDKCVVMCKRGGRTVMEILSFRPSEEA